jgi:hypothetical protein
MQALVLGNLAGLAVAEGMDDEQIECALLERVRHLVIGAINDSRNNFHRSIKRRGNGCISCAPKPGSGAHTQPIRADGR